jgi:hypothetical protein
LRVAAGRECFGWRQMRQLVTHDARDGIVRTEDCSQANTVV